MSYFRFKIPHPMVLSAIYVLCEGNFPGELGKPRLKTLHISFEIQQPQTYSTPTRPKMCCPKAFKTIGNIFYLLRSFPFHTHTYASYHGKLGPFSKRRYSEAKGHVYIVEILRKRQFQRRYDVQIEKFVLQKHCKL